MHSAFSRIEHREIKIGERERIRLHSRPRELNVNKVKSSMPEREEKKGKERRRTIQHIIDDVVYERCGEPRENL